MKCPFCANEMQQGIISGDGRSGVIWEAGGKKISALDKFIGVGVITAAKHSLTKFKIEACYCENCKKMIFDTDIQK
ncbi:MAG: MarR family transcriptional regulator [Oribacterium sp.]|nr:MarR family transcriptional regulator [Oribacterium sp.]